MNRYLDKRNYWLYMVLVIALFNACKKSDVASDTKDLYVYAAPGNAAYNVLANGSIALVRNTVLSGANTSFPVLLTRSFSKDVQVTASIDTSLVKTYDSLYNDTTSLTAPSGAFALANDGKATIPAGQTSSKDSIQVILVDATKIKTGTNIYIVPVVLNTATSGVPTSDTRQVMYLQIKVVSIAEGITGLNGGNFVDIVLNSVNGVNTGPGMAYLRGVLNNGIGKNTTITVKDNSALIQAYNTTNGTNYQAFPSGSYQLSKPTATIPANAAVSADSIAVALSNLNAFTTGQDYLLPIQIVDNNDPASPPVDQAKNVAYIHVSVFVNNIDPSNSGLTGSTMNRSSWSATASDDYFGYYPASNAIDGDNSSYWIGNGVPNWIQIDMGNANTVKGFTVVPDPYDDLKQIEVYSSQNGSSWKKEGVYNSTNQLRTSVTKTIKFVNTVTGRYFKFNVTATSSGSYAGMAELNGIQ